MNKYTDTTVFVQDCSSYAYVIHDIDTNSAALVHIMYEHALVHNYDV